MPATAELQTPQRPAPLLRDARSIGGGGNRAGRGRCSARSSAAAFGFGLVIALRAAAGLEIFQTEQTGYPHLIVPALTAPLGFIAGIGCFDYWLRWAIGSATAPEDHSDHGADSWRDYFSSTPITR